MAIISRSELRAFEGQHKSFAEARVAQAGQNSSAKTPPLVFLSHSHKDKDLVLGAKKFLESMGGNVYVDWLDDGLPDETSIQTAKTIKAKIETCSRFVLLASEGAILSRWVPWELGYADAKKGLEKIAIFPVREDDQPFMGSEYLSLYPSITKSGDYSWVTMPGDGRATQLAYWLNDSLLRVLFGPTIPINPTVFDKPK